MAEKRVDFTYDDLGQYATIITYANLAGTQLVSTATYTFDDAYELVGLTYTKGATTLASYGYSYDDAGNMTQMVTLDGTTNYTSDDTGQLTVADSTYTDDESYVYDDNGNRVTANGDTYATGDDNQLTSDGDYRYTYDAEGNRTSKFVDTDVDGVLDAGDTDITTYAWDYRNRLAEVDHFTTYANYSADTSDQIVEYAYDAFNRLIGRILDADGSAGTGDIAETVYAYDGDQIALQFDKTYANGSASDLSASDLSHRYLWNSQAVDQLFADEKVTSLGTAGAMLWALTDHENSVRDLATYDSGTDVTTIANHRVYDSFGNLKSETNAAVDCLFGYTGRMFDEATGLQNNLNRWYDSSAGRWMSQDPIGFNAGDSNLYRYVGNSPTNYIDPSGLDWLDSYADWFNGVFGRGYSKAAGNVIYQASVGSGAISNNTLANASANQLAAATTAVAIPVGIGIAVGGEAIVVAAYTNAVAITNAVGTAIVAPGAMVYEGALSLATAISIRYPTIWTSIAYAIEPSWGATLSITLGDLAKWWNNLGSHETKRCG